MATSDDLTTILESAASSPAAAEADGVKMTARSVDDLIKLDNHLAAKRSGANGFGGIRMAKIVPGGATSRKQAP